MVSFIGRKELSRRFQGFQAHCHVTIFVQSTGETHTLLHIEQNIEELVVKGQACL